MFARLKAELDHPIEFAWLIGLVFFLPLFEAPKNLCWLGYVLAWLWNRARARDFGGPWDRWDTLIALWIASGYLAAAFAGVHYDEWKGANDLLRYGSVLWLVRRSRFSERALLVILGTTVVSTLITLAWGYWRVYVARTNFTLGLNSVGHVNHSAIYMAIVFGVALSLAIAYGRRVGRAAKAALLAAVVVLAVSVYLTESRAAVAAALLYAIGLALLARRRPGVARVTLAPLVAVAVVFVFHPALLTKTEERLKEGLALSFRDQIWRNALVEWREHPWFGVGMDNFGRVDWKELQRWSERDNGPVRASREGLASHAHSLYFNTLAERGLVGLAALVAVLAAWAIALARALPRAEDPPLDWALYGSALSGGWMSASVGVFNTSLHHEHAILSVLLLGLWLSHRGVAIAKQRALLAA